MFICLNVVENSKIDGEWYEFSGHEAQYAKEIIEELEEGC